MSDDHVPVIDINPFLVGDKLAKRAVARQVDEALRTIGFMTIVGHGVSNDLIRRARETALEFFGHDLDEKMKVANPPEHMSRGYNWVGNRSLAYTLDEETPADLQEGFAFGPFDLGDEPYYKAASAASFLAPNIWPGQPATFRAVFEEYYLCLASLAGRIMALFAVALDLPESYFDDKIDRHTSVIRALHYPAQSEPPASGQLRAGAHTDYGTLTVLYGDDTPGGLQVKQRDGDWIDVHPAPDALVCNIGDLMSRWTNDRWVSNLHRVVNPPLEYSGDGRISIPFFHNTNHDALIQCIPSCLGADGVAKYSPVLFSEHYLSKQTRAERKPELTDRKPHD
jgi:isopenicillin N synthase-like dioxygenase